MDALRPVKSRRTKARTRARWSGLATLGATKTPGYAQTSLNAATTAKTHIVEIHAMVLEPCKGEGQATVLSRWKMY